MGLPAVAAVEWIPRPKGRGLIEGTAVTNLIPRIRAIPRPKGRGLIEGGPSADSRPLAGGGFRGRKVAASLKDHPPMFALMLLAGFRGRKVAASLKDDVAVAQDRIRLGFRGRKVAASLKDMLRSTFGLKVS